MNDSSPTTLPLAPTSPAPKPKRGRPTKADAAARAAGRTKTPEPEAAPIEPLPAGRLTRKSNNTSDKFYIDPALIPDGWTYQWIREETYGAKDVGNVNDMMSNHWRPVPADRHAKMLTAQGGMRLYERPKYLTDDALREKFQDAQGQLAVARGQMAATPEGTFTRDHPSARRATKLNVDYSTAIRGGESEERR